MKIAYWMVAVALGSLYTVGGSKKLLQSKEQLAPVMGWVDTIPMWGVRSIGLLEILGVLGLVLPPLTGIAVGLAVAAAVGFTVLQVLATALHASRGEFKEIGLNIGLVVLGGAEVWLATVW